MYRFRKTLVTLLFVLFFVSPASAEIQINIAAIQNGFVHVEGGRAPRRQAILWEGVSVGIDSNSGGSFQFDTTNLPPDCVGTLKIGSETREVVIENCTPAAVTVFQAGVPKTGQTFSFAARDDGSLQKGVPSPTPRFTKNVNSANDTGVGSGIANNGICDGTESCNGTITDHLTGLIWLQNANCPSSGTTWQGALDFVAGINNGTNNCGDTSNAGSHQTDWRLPNVRELHSLVAYGCDPTNDTACLPQPNPFFEFRQAPFWSSTNSGFPWNVDFFLGAVNFVDQSSLFFVTAVRGGS